ncbi:hypothetical protein LAD25_08785 [Escherichia coli]|nr:hypothetical protein [Escherichia coli]
MPHTAPTLNGASRSVAEISKQLSQADVRQACTTNRRVYHVIRANDGTSVGDDAGIGRERLNGNGN